MSNKSYKFRAFISYAHSDKELVLKIADILETFDIRPLWDKDINPGKSFTEEIKELITRTHIFIPLITSNSHDRPWVHQETGFAIALDIPILPIAIGAIPGEMISFVQAISVQSDLSDLVDRLNEFDLEKLVIPPPPKPHNLVEVAHLPEDRVKLIADNANWMLTIGEYGKVRSQAKLGHFSVPDRPINHPVWDERDGNIKRSDKLREDMREERRVLERHARVAGRKLIVDPFAVTFNTSGPLVRRARLLTLLEFLKGMPTEKVEIVMSAKAQDTNLVIVGDYFVAESMAPRPGVGYFQTIIDSHPPRVLRKIKAFDQLFDELKSEKDTSVQTAILKIEQIVSELGSES